MLDAAQRAIAGPAGRLPQRVKRSRPSRSRARCRSPRTTAFTSRAAICSCRATSQCRPAFQLEPVPAIALLVAQPAIGERALRSLGVAAGDERRAQNLPASVLVHSRAASCSTSSAASTSGYADSGAGAAITTGIGNVPLSVWRACRREDILEDTAHFLAPRRQIATGSRRRCPRPPAPGRAPIARRVRARQSRRRLRRLTMSAQFASGRHRCRRPAPAHASGRAAASSPAAWHRSPAHAMRSGGIELRRRSAHWASRASSIASSASQRRSNSRHQACSACASGASNVCKRVERNQIVVQAPPAACGQPCGIRGIEQIARRLGCSRRRRPRGFAPASASARASA